MPADTEAIHREMLLVVKCMNKDVPIPIWIYNPITEPVWNRRISDPDTNRTSLTVFPVPLL